MPRTSPLYYIAPSAISIVPNANGRANDLAVMVVKGTKIKLCHPDIPQLRPVGASYQEWTIAGLNRSLANSAVPYTIYARLAKDDKQNGYIVFAPQVPTETEEEGAETTWNDPYVLSPNTSGTSSYGAMDAHGRIKKWDPIPAAQAANGKSNYWWVRLGEVLQPENGERSVMLDTGILGTDLYNADWNLNPDALPFRIELVCSIGDKDVGATPYVGWGKSIKIDAHLVEGWEDAADARVVRWTIARNTGAAEPDQHWNNPQPGEQGRTMPGGSITLTHEHGSGDDFDGAVAAAFTITAWGEVVEDSEAPDAETPTAELLELASITITILAETVESYQLELSSSTVTFNPLTNTYSPNGGVRVRIRAKAQDGEVFYLDDEYIAVAGIHVFYRPVDDDDDDPTELQLVNGQGILPTSLFSSGLSYNLWIENTDGENLDRATVSYLRFGEKGDTPISIFRWYKVGLTPVKPTATNSEEPAPASGDATGSTNVYPTDKWSKTAPNRPATGEWALWMCNSIKHGSGIIDAWSQPTRISGDKGENGEDATDREYIYRRLDVFPFSGDLPKNINTGTISGQPSTDKTKDDWVPTGWSDNALPATDSEKYVYMSSREKRPGQSWSAFSDPILWSNYGVQGIDGDGVQYVYKLFDHELPAAERESNIPSMPDKPTQDGEWIPSGWSDDPLAPTTDMPFCYCSVIKKINGTWGDFGELGLWSKWAEDGKTPISIFRWYKMGLTPVKPTATNSEEPAPASGDATGSTNVYPTDKWSKTAPNRPATGEWALWMCNSIKHGSGIIDAWSQPTRISGDKGENGEDATDREYIYRRLDVFPFSGDLPKNINTGTISGQPSTDKTKDDWVPTGWSDNALPATDSEKYVYMSSREKRPGQSWSAFSDPILWSNYGVQGIDGDGVQYVYKLFDHELPAAERESNIPSMPDKPTQDGEWIPSGWSDDPLAPTTDMPFCYCSVIKKIKGDWGDFGELGLWSKWAEDGKDGAVTPLCRLIPSTLLVPATSDGACLAAFSASVDAEMPIGSSLATVTAATIVSKPSIYVGASASVAQGKAVISVTIAQGVPEANFKGVILVELTGTYLGKTYTAKAGITLGASKQGGQGGQGEQGIQGEQGEDAVSVFLTNEVVILSQATVSPYTIDLTTAFTEAVVIKGTSPQTNFTVAVGSTYHCSASLDDSNTKRVKITAIGQSGGTYYDSGYVIINVTFDGITYQKKYNFYANLLGTWKETVVGDTKTEVAKSLSYGYDGTYTHTIDSMGQYIKSSQENISTLQQTVGDSNGGLVKDVSEIRQTASDISLKVSKSVSANLLHDPIFKNDLGFTGHGGNTSAACAITQFPNSDNGNVENPWMAAGGRLLEVKVTSVTSSGNMWLTPHLAQRVALQAGKKYTFSVWVFLSDESALGYTKNIVELSLWNGNARPSTRPIITYNDKADRTAGKFVQLYKTFEVTAPYTEFTWLPYIHLVASKPITVCFAGAKLEISESPTDMSFDYSGDVQKNLQEDLLATGIDITHQQIILTANQFFCRNNNGQTTASLDSNGNFTIAGVLNNLIINISSDNVSNYGYSVLGASEWWIDPLHCPSVIKAPAGKIHLPVAYYNAGAQVEARKAGAGASMVLDEMRQCIGKRFWLLLNDDSSNKYQFKIGSGSIPLLVVKRKLINAKDDLFDVATGNEYACSEAAELYNDYTPSAPSSYYLECKCGLYKGYECIYWETCAIGSHL